MTTSEERKEEMLRYCEKYGYEDSTKVYQHMAEKYPDVSRATHRGMFGRLLRSLEAAPAMPLDEQLVACGFHDGKRQVIKRPTKQIEVPIPNTSKVYDYRTECSLAYKRATDQGFDDAARHLHVEWHWANGLLEDPKTLAAREAAKAAREAKAAKAVQGDLLAALAPKQEEPQKTGKSLPARKGREKLQHVKVKRADTKARQQFVIDNYTPRSTQASLLRAVKREFHEPAEAPTLAMIVQAFKAAGDHERYAQKMESLFARRECPTCDAKAFMVDDIYVVFGFREKNARSQSYCRECRTKKGSK